MKNEGERIHDLSKECVSEGRKQGGGAVNMCVCVCVLMCVFFFTTHD